MNAPKSRLRPTWHIPALLRRDVTDAGRFARAVAISRVSVLDTPPRGNAALRNAAPGTLARKYD